jgi:hypothetical protein
VVPSEGHAVAPDDHQKAEENAAQTSSSWICGRIDQRRTTGT